MTFYVRLPLKKAYNVRELGGYPTIDGKVTVSQKFLRGDDLTELTEADITFLLEYGVTSVLDLRSDIELEHAPNPLANHSSIYYLHKSLLDVGASSDSFEDFGELIEAEHEDILANMYIHILKESQKEIKEIFNWFADQEGCVLFHCTAGKDRTGVIAMLLLGLAGVSEEDIIANYMVTQIYNKANPEETMMNLPIELPKELLESKPEFMIKAYHYLVEKYENVENYFLQIGIDKVILDTIKEKFVT